MREIWSAARLASVRDWRPATRCAAALNAPPFSRCIASAAGLKASPGRRRRSTNLSEIWNPTGGITASHDKQSGSLALLTQAGFIRQSGSGIFHLLPLGLRVQEKVEGLIDKHMRSLGASKVSLSSITSESLWARSGRFNADGTGHPELYRLRDSRSTQNTGFLLAPTHEEEITNIVANEVRSYRDVPLRLYQISRKYRNELRPRQGLLRAREFVMKDLYTFDRNHEVAMRTYDAVRSAYINFFDELKIPYLVAEADSGNMGGNLSHEFHFVSNDGEDNVISCDSCDYVANEEKAFARIRSGEAKPDEVAENITTMICVTQNGRDLVVAVYPKSNGEDASAVNWHALKRAVPDVVQDTAEPIKKWTSYVPQESSKLQKPAPRELFVVVDYRIPASSVPTRDEILKNLTSQHGSQPSLAIPAAAQIISVDPSTSSAIDLLPIKTGDRCPKCEPGTLKVQKAVEMGHTFHLGTRYSVPLRAYVGMAKDDPRYYDPEAGVDTSTHTAPLEMGCHGIGVSRLVGAVASLLADDRGLNWPSAIAPFEVVVIPGDEFYNEAADVCDMLSDAGIDAVLDDRKGQTSMVWKMKDADMVGYPVLVIVSKRSWSKDRSVEVQCRRLDGGYKKLHRVGEEDVAGTIIGLLDRL